MPNPTLAKILSKIEIDIAVKKRLEKVNFQHMCKMGKIETTSKSTTYTK